MRNSLSTKEMARELGITVTRLNMLGRDGVLARESDNLWNRERTKKAFLENVRVIKGAEERREKTRNAGKPTRKMGVAPRVVTVPAAEDDQEVPDGRVFRDETGPVRGSKAAVELRKILAEARLKDLQFRQQARELVPVADVQRVWGGQISSIKNSFLLLPAKLAAKLAGETEILEVQAILDVAIRQILTELSQYQSSNVGAAKPKTASSESAVEYVQ